MFHHQVLRYRQAWTRQWTWDIRECWYCSISQDTETLYILDWIWEIAWKQMRGQPFDSTNFETPSSWDDCEPARCFWHQHLGEGDQFLQCMGISSRFFEKFLQKWCFFWGGDIPWRSLWWFVPFWDTSTLRYQSKPEAKTVTGGLTMPAFAARVTKRGTYHGGIGEGWPLDAPT